MNFRRLCLTNLPKIGLEIDLPPYLSIISFLSNQWTVFIGLRVWSVPEVSIEEQIRIVTVFFTTTLCHITVQLWENMIWILFAFWTTLVNLFFYSFLHLSSLSSSCALLLDCHTLGKRGRSPDGVLVFHLSWVSFSNALKHGCNRSVTSSLFSRWCLHCKLQC